MSKCPYGSGDELPPPYGSNDLTYNDYLKVSDLLKLQRPQSSPAHHDEMLFIVIHQAYELWFKLVLHELQSALAYMDEGKVLRAHHFVKRCVEIFRILVPQIHILETMTPIEFLEFRDHLNPASGFQSTQFRELEFLAGLKDERYLKYFGDRPDLLAILRSRLEGRDLRTGFYELLSRSGFTMPQNAGALDAETENPQRTEILEALKPLYENPEANLPLYLLAESLVDLDSGLSAWREHHVRVVERVIGFKRGTGGSSGAEYLRSTTSKRCFPSLWEVRSVLEKRHK